MTFEKDDKSIDVKFEQSLKKKPLLKKESPIEVTFEKEDKSIDVNFKQPSKKESPIEVTFEKEDKSIDVKFEQYLKKLSPIFMGCTFDLNNTIFADSIF